MRQDSYATRQSRMDLEYEKEFNVFLEGLSPLERSRLEEGGCASADTSRTVDKSGDFADWQVGTSPEGMPSEEEIDKGEGMARKAEVLEAMQMLLSNVFYPGPGRTREYELDVMGIAIGMLGMVSIAHVARRHGVGRQAISKAAIKFCADLGLPPSIYMKSEANRDLHRQTNKRGKKRA